MLSANPIDTARLTLSDELRAIEETIRIGEHRAQIRVISAWAVRANDVMQLLCQHQPHIVHFSGHGTEREELLLVGPDGEAQPLAKPHVRRLFRILRDNIRLVFLNACYSADQADAIVDSIDCVIGVQSAVGDDASRIFAAAFYGAIALGRSVQSAFDLAALALAIKQFDEQFALRVRDGVDPAALHLLGTG